MAESLAPPTLQDLVLRSIKRTYDMFSGDTTVSSSASFLASQKVKIALKVGAEYNVPKAPVPAEEEGKKKEGAGGETGAILKSLEDEKEKAFYDRQATSAAAGQGQMVTYKDASGQLITTQANSQIPAGMGPPGSVLALRRAPPKVPKPTWHAPWKLSAVVAGHLGWVRAVAFDPSNEWFVTGSADRTIKVWDLGKCSAGVEGGLKLTLTGHISAVRALAVSERFPYLFSCAEDKMVKCWDLEQNKVVRQYHGHLSGVYCLALHPTLDILVTGGRDSVARVWDIRTKQPIHVLSGHTNTVNTVVTNSVDPQIISGSSDSTIKLWDLAAGKAMMTLTHHKKAVRDIKIHPKEQSFVSAAQDNIKKWQVRDGRFVKNLSGHNAVLNTLAINQDGVLISGGDNGSLRFWDYESGYCFQQTETIVQPGSLDCEAGIYASSFDVTGTRFLTCETDKTIKIWREDAEATEESHPIDMKSWTQQCLAPKRF